LSHHPTHIINQEINEDDVFADEDLEIQNDLNLSVNQTDDLLNIVKTRLHEIFVNIGIFKILMLF
jgi:hypothetical protein